MLLRKYAAVGDTNDESFESSFASLAYSYVKGKVPRLMDYLRGFQLVERNEDQTKALGVFGFEIGDRSVFIPVFFLSGDLKGHDMLIVGRRIVPAKENWVTFLQGERPHVLGQKSKDPWRESSRKAPDLRRMLSPSYKVGSMVKIGGSTIRLEAFPVHVPIAGPGERFAPTLGGVQFLARHRGKIAGFNGLKHFDLRRHLVENPTWAFSALDAASRHPRMKRAFDKFYGPKFFEEIGSELEFRKRAEQEYLESFLDAGKPPKKLEVIVDDVLDPEGKAIAKDDDERGKLLETGVLVRDRREDDEVSEAYDLDSELELLNPVETGIYDVLTKPGDFEEMLVVHNPREASATLVQSLLVRTDDKNWLNIDTAKVFAKPMTADQAANERFDPWFKGLDANHSMSAGKHYMMLGPDGRGTTPFEVEESMGDGVFYVRFKSSLGESNCGYFDSSASYHNAFSRSRDRLPRTYGAVYLRINPGKGTRPKFLDGQFYVPSEFKCVPLADPIGFDGPGAVNIGYSNYESPDDRKDTQSKKRPIMPGSMMDAQLLMVEKTAHLKVYTNRAEYALSGDREPKSPWLSKTAALCRLIQHHGFREATARELLDRADSKGSTSVRVKYAAFDPSMGDHARAPAFPEPNFGSEEAGPHRSVPTIYSQEEEVPIDSLAPPSDAHDAYDPWQEQDPQAVRDAEQAAETGNKELFDTQMVTSLLRSNPVEWLVEPGISNLFNALHTIGAIRMALYWNPDSFEQRYGRDDLPELENAAQKAFNDVGDLALFLEERSSNPAMPDDEHEPNLDGISDS